MFSTPGKITAATAAAVLSLGLAGPALAGTTGSDPGKASSHSGLHAAPTLAQVQAWLTARIDKRIAWIDAALAKIAASTVLTDAQKADWTTKLTAKRVELVALEAAVAAATSVDAVKAAVDASGLEHLLFGHRFGRHHDGTGGNGCGGKSHKDPAAKANHAAAVRAAVKHTPTSTHSVTKPRVRTVTFAQSGSFGHGFFGHGLPTGDGRHAHHFGGGHHR